MADPQADSQAADASNLNADDLCRRDADSEDQPHEAMPHESQVCSADPVISGGVSSNVALAQPSNLSARAAEVIEMVTIKDDRPDSKQGLIDVGSMVGNRGRGDSGTSAGDYEDRAVQVGGHDNDGSSSQDYEENVPLLLPITRRDGRESGVANITSRGVLQRSTFTTRLSTVKSTPKWNLTGKLKIPAILDTPAGREERRGAAPAPWRYTLPPPDKTRPKAPSSSFGSGSSRFGSDDGPDKFLPGPGQYTRQDRTFSGAKYVFGTEERMKQIGKSVVKPGPGAHDVRRTLGHKAAYSMTGRPSTSQLTKSWSSPGPGFYSPQTHEVERTPMQTTFGSASREMERRRAMGYDVKSKLANPGPGAYDVQNLNKMGQTGVKHSMAIRQYYSDVASRYTPGPGSYNAHTTSFGY